MVKRQGIICFGITTEFSMSVRALLLIGAIVPLTSCVAGVVGAAGAVGALGAVGGALRNDRCQRCSRASLFHRTRRPNTTPAPLPAVFPAYPHFPLSSTSFTNTHSLIANAYSSTFFNIHAQDFSPSAQHAPEHRWQRSLRACALLSTRRFFSHRIKNGQS